MEIIEVVEQQTREIENEYYQKISLLEKGLDNKEILRLKEEKMGRILKIYQGNKLVAHSLEELSRIQEGDFKEKLRFIFTTTTTAEAHSEKLNEGAYYCYHCKLWIVGSARNGHLPDEPYGSWDYYFCRICDSIVGRLTLEIRRMRDRSYRP